MTMNKMKHLFMLVMGILLTGALASADEVASTIEISSFIMAGTRTRAAEICGKVSGATAPFVTAKITVDPKSSRPGTYNVLVGSDGKYCVTVVTFSGTAEASLWSASGNSKSELVYSTQAQDAGER
jgi:hypothetical protein